MALPKLLSQIHPSDLILGIVTLAIVWFIPQRLSRYIPGPLLALLLGTTLNCFILNDVTVIGEIPSSFPSIQLPVFSIKEFAMIIMYLLVLAFLVSIDSLYLLNVCLIRKQRV